MAVTRIILAAACIWVLAGCERPQGIPLTPRVVRAPSDDQMERLAVYSAFLCDRFRRRSGRGAGGGWRVCWFESLCRIRGTNWLTFNGPGGNSSFKLDREAALSVS
jgi:hypothetical protein